MGDNQNKIIKMMNKVHLTEIKDYSVGILCGGEQNKPVVSGSLFPDDIYSYTKQSINSHTEGLRD